MSQKHRVTALVCLAAALLLARTALAGPPLICHWFVTGTAPVLPWIENTNDWFSPDRHYRIENLTADTLRLLTPDAPIVARMENLRRAALYASLDATIGTELLSAIVTRMSEATDPRARALASFDAAYLVATYGQLENAGRPDLLALFKAQAAPATASKVANLDTLALVRDAEAAAPDLTPELEFAAYLMSGATNAAAQHRDRAVAGAAAGSLLAQNLAHSR
jgi:hypothetical protein